MPLKRRIDKSRSGRITPRAVVLFEYLVRLPRPVKWTEDARNLELEFEVTLGLQPHWPHPVFDCDHDEPPMWMDDPDRRADWCHMRELRLDLEDALQERNLPPAA
jgi:hypothetical protein